MAGQSAKVGRVTVKITGDLQRRLEAVAAGAADGLASALVEIADTVATEASDLWYRQVERETGQSGQIGVESEVGGERLRLRVGSTDRRVAKNGKPVAVYIHRPGPLSLVEVEVSRAEYYAAPKEQRAKYPRLRKLNPLHSDGKYLLPELVGNPMRAALKAAQKQISKAAAKGATSARRKRGQSGR